MCVWSGGGWQQQEVRLEKKVSKYVGIPYIQSYIKLKVLSSSASLVLKQTKGVTDRKGI